MLTAGAYSKLWLYQGPRGIRDHGKENGSYYSIMGLYRV